MFEHSKQILNYSCRAAVAVAALVALPACSNIAGLNFTSFEGVEPKSVASAPPLRGTSKEKECLMRAMYFESNRSSEEGMLAVGTVVMNRVTDHRFDDNICDVVGAPRQFAPGVMTRKMTEERPVALASKVADRILSGERHPGVRHAKFFHTAGLRFPYNNMNYVLEAGGNEFYIKGKG